MLIAPNVFQSTDDDAVWAGLVFNEKGFILHILGTNAKGGPNGRMFGEVCLSEGLLVVSNPDDDALYCHKNDIGHPDKCDCSVRWSVRVCQGGVL